MEPFNNLERWDHLKDIIRQTPMLYTRIQKIWRAKSELLLGKPGRTSIADFVHFIYSGSNRDIYRIGNGASCPVELDGHKIILAVKLPRHPGAAREFGSYTSQRQLDTSKDLNNDFNLLNIEAMTFEKRAMEGKTVPRVTGIVAGYGLLGTLTEDLTEGGVCEVNREGYNSPVVIKRYPDGRKEEVSVDWKYLGDTTDVTTDYFTTRLQIDRPPPKKSKAHRSTS